MYRCRKNQATLSTTEKSNFVAAVLELKRIGKYDQYVQDHMNFMQAAHRGPAFFPWHREFLRRFELDLQAIDSSVTLPYWDWTVDNSPTSSIWDPIFMGGNGRLSDGQVMTGPFAFNTGNWPLNFESFPAFGFLRRRFGVSASTLPSPADLNDPVTGALNITPYDVAPYDDGFFTAGFRNRLEGWFSGPQLHNRVHVWVGGSMGPASSPNDPVFFLNHCMEDKLWADWQRLHPTEGYLPISPIAGKPGHSLNEAMQPWAGLGQNVTPANVLDHHALGYAYDTEGVCLPTLKFIDDRPDIDAIIKALRDGRATLKFNDDVKLKFTDDSGTLKFRDDKPKFTDDIITLKFRDDVGTSPRIDPIKQPGLDKPPLADAVKQPGLDKAPGADGPGMPGSLQEGAAPFALSTPHHSMAWAQSFSEAHRATLDQYESAIIQYEQKIREINETFEKGQLSEADMQAAESVFQEYQAMLAEYQRLTQQGQ
jgi:tyrosinase